MCFVSELLKYFEHYSEGVGVRIVKGAQQTNTLEK